LPRRLGPLRLPRIRCSRAVARRWLLTAAALAWLAVGGYGCFAYIDAYWTYRGFPPPRDPAGVPSGSLRRESFFSPALRAWRSYLVYLPPGYGAAARRLVRFPALYLLHPPPGRPDEYVQAGAAAVRLDELIHRNTLRPFLLVLPFGSSRRFRNDTEWANAGAGRYENFVLDTVHAVDSRWSTRRERAGRAIAGLSEGGYGAMNIALHHLDTFSVAESWSGYFDQTRSAAFAGASDSLLRANSPSAYVGGLARALRRMPLHAFVYQGNRDDVPLSALQRFAGRLRRAGGHVWTAVWPGHHSWRLWHAHVPAMLSFAGHWLGGGSGREPRGRGGRSGGRRAHGPRAGLPRRRRHRSKR